MNNIIKLPVKSKGKPEFLNTPKTKDVAATKAKTAKTPAQKQKIVEKVREKAKRKAKMNAPSELARCRAIVGGDMAAATLIYRMAYLFRTINPKMTRNGREWLAMSRADLAMSACGLTEYEMNHRALPRVKKYASNIVEIQAQGNGGDKKLWFIVDLEAYSAALNEGGYELVVTAKEGVELFAQK